MSNANAIAVSDSDSDAAVLWGDCMSDYMKVIAEMSAAHAAQCRVIDTLRGRVRELEAELDRLNGDSRAMDAIVAEQYPDEVGN